MELAKKSWVKKQLGDARISTNDFTDALKSKLDDIEDNATADQTGDNLVFVNTVAELQIAVAAQTAGQFIYVMPGQYVLTASLTILLAASGGGLLAAPGVELIGAADADEAILIDPAVSDSTFEYTIEGFASIKGGAGKIGLNVANTAITKKVNVLLKRTNLHDNGAGKALTAINTDGSNAIRIYADGPAEIDSIAFTPKDGGDRLIMNNYNVDENVVVAVVDCTATFMWKQCKIPVAGITGGHANNVCSVINCWTEATAFVPVLPAETDFPGDFAETILPVS